MLSPNLSSLLPDPLDAPDEPGVTAPSPGEGILSVPDGRLPTKAESPRGDLPNAEAEFEPDIEADLGSSIEGLDRLLENEASLAGASYREL